MNHTRAARTLHDWAVDRYGLAHPDLLWLAAAYEGRTGGVTVEDLRTVVADLEVNDAA
jgi:hypothetical protein